MNTFFIGMGYMGFERLKSLKKLEKKFNLKMVGYYDPNTRYITYNNKKIFSAKKINSNFFFKNNISLCIISTPHYLIKKYAILALRAKVPINLFIEKPFGLNFKEAEEIYKEKKQNQKIFIGLNYRYFSGIKNLINDIKLKKFGKINSIHMIMGHGHYPEIKKTWKINKKLAGGGVILDPGIHLINLLQLFTKKNLKIKYVEKIMNFWNTGIDEEALLILSSKDIPLISLNISIARWRSTFQILVNGHNGYGIVEGRGRSYGPQSYLRGKRWAWKAGKAQRKTEKIISKSDEKKIFYDEMHEVLNIIKHKKARIYPCNEIEGMKTMKLISKIYANG